MDPIVRRAALGTGLALPALTLATRVSATPSVEEPVGTPIRLEGTPHLFLVSADSPQLHWVGDTRALSQYPVFWNQQRTWSYWVFRRWGFLWMGDPYLSAGLLKDGDPIYLVKWEQHWAEPILYHIQSIKDVELFGINARNYGKFVLDKAAWEAKYGFDASTLQRVALRPATWGQWRPYESSTSPGIIYYDEVATPTGNGSGEVVAIQCVRRSEQWRVRVVLPSRFQHYSGPVQVESSIFSTPVAAVSRRNFVEWTGGRDLAAGLIALLEDAYTQATLTIRLPNDQTESIELWAAGIETADAWLNAECAKE